MNFMIAQTVAAPCIGLESVAVGVVQDGPNSSVTLFKNSMMNKPSAPDERLDAIRVLFDELRELIELTIVNEGSKAIALQHLRAARTNCVIGADRKA